jgi:hypothetical protein
LRDCPLGNDLGDKDDTSSALVALVAANVEPKVHFIKVSVKRDRKKPKELGMTKPEAHQADIGSPLKGIEYGSRRDVAAQKFAVHFVVQHHQVTPFSGKKYALSVSHLFEVFEMQPSNRLLRIQMAFLGPGFVLH